MIGANTVIGDHCTIGDDVQIGTCCSIGTENFEYHKFQDEWRKIPAIGTVSIGNHVRIGGNVVYRLDTRRKSEYNAILYPWSPLQAGQKLETMWIFMDSLQSAIM